MTEKSLQTYDERGRLPSAGCSLICNSPPKVDTTIADQGCPKAFFLQNQSPQWTLEEMK